MEKGQRRDLYQEVADRILGLLDQRVVPWRNPIRGGGAGQWPKNLTSGKGYRGINGFLLIMRAWEQGYRSAH